MEKAATFIKVNSNPIGENSPNLVTLVDGQVINKNRESVKYYCNRERVR
jgi:hypothetical protein